MIFEVSHKTVYHYTAPVAQAHHLVHLAPRPHPRQRVVRHTLLVEPVPASRSDFTDYFGNPASTLSIESNHTELLIHSRCVVDVVAPKPIDVKASEPWDRVAASLAPARKSYDIEVAQYLMPSHHTTITPRLIAFAEPFFPPGRPILECARDLTNAIYTGFAYDNAATDIATTIEEVLSIRRGVCQDFAHLLIGAMRAYGLPARYVSGYLLTYPAPGKEKLVGADASHAWVSVWAPQIGWVDFDPTNNLIPRDEHITIAYGRDFQDVSPVTGVLLGGGKHKIDVAVDVTPALTAAR
ncbi:MULTISPECIES: transglutaminase family protein [Rhodomicrobium]|uniref:transglutaminase family protein n=1 Tax=Rhodomicrobium TaxID=1068 RepID=UPI000B4BAEC4|nr:MULTISPECIES: transglutaminase family protein [Rhodomicrobium]